MGVSNMEEWKEYTLGELLKIKYGKDHKKMGVGDIPVYGSGGIMRTGDAYLSDKPSVLIPRKGTLSNIFYVEKPFWTVDTMFWSEINDNIVIPKYLYYAIKDYKWDSMNVGSAVPSLTVPVIESVSVSIPSIGTQEKIAAQLSEIDDKIAINRRICENLEAQAQALFKHWFIDFAPFKEGKFVESELGMIPEGWRVGTLGDIAVITMGQSPAGSSYNEKGEGVIFYQGRTEFGFRYPSVRLYTTEPKRFAEPLSTLLSVRAPVGDINVATERCCIGRGLASIKSNNNCHSYIFYLLQSMKRRFDVYNGEGTVFGSINKDTLNGLKIFIPNNTIISDFEEIVEEIDKKILESHQESSRLSALCDTLLPKLMSGEIKV
jgi:type I restriction enzyme S subunit